MQLEYVFWQRTYVKHLCISIPYEEKDIFLWCQFQKVLQVFIKPFNFSFLAWRGTHFTCQKGNAQNLSSQASAVHEPRTSRCTSWVQKRPRNQRSNCQHPLDYGESKGVSTSASLTALQPLTMWNTTNCSKFLEMGVPKHITCLLRNFCTGQEIRVRTRY